MRGGRRSRGVLIPTLRGGGAERLPRRRAALIDPVGVEVLNRVAERGGAGMTVAERLGVSARTAVGLGVVDPLTYDCRTCARASVPAVVVCPRLDVLFNGPGRRRLRAAAMLDGQPVRTEPLRIPVRRAAVPVLARSVVRGPVRRGSRAARLPRGMPVRAAAGLATGDGGDKGAAADPGATQAAAATQASRVPRTLGMRVYVASGRLVGQPPPCDWTNLGAQTRSPPRRHEAAGRRREAGGGVGDGGPLELP